MSKVKNESYYSVQGWMVNDLELKGTQLHIYAIIYGFSQTDDQYFTGSQQYLADWTNSTTRGVRKMLKALVEKGLLVKRDKVINNVKYCEYKALRNPIGTEQSSAGGTEQSSVGTEQSSAGTEQSSAGGTEQSSANNIDINNIDINNKENKKKERKSTTYDSILSSMDLEPRLKETLIEFIKMRKLIKSPMTDHALELLIKKLEKMSSDVDVQIEILNQSIQNSWKGIFPIDKKKQVNNASNALEDDYQRYSDWSKKRIRDIVNSTPE